MVFQSSAQDKKYDHSRKPGRVSSQKALIGNGFSRMEMLLASERGVFFSI